ncbi:MAG: barstar family protein [Leptolyngbya sp. BL-A-14]
MDKLVAVLRGEGSPGLYTLETPISTDDLVTLSQKHGAHLFCLNGAGINNKSEFLHAIASAMSFPDYFGKNWDALDDCLTDLDWLEGDRLVLLYDQPDRFAQADPSEWQVALDILRSTVEYWRTNNRSFSVFFKGSHTDWVGLDSL